MSGLERASAGLDAPGYASPGLDADVRAAANAIVDPCSAAAGHDLGLSEMGLIRDVETTAHERGVAVTVTLRLTAPGCFYYLFFERELRTRVGALPGVADVTVRRDPAYDWTEDDIAPAVRRRLRERRKRLQAANPMVPA